VKFGVTTYLWSADFTDATVEELPDLREWGFEGVEFPLFRPEGYPAGAVRRALKSRGLECTTALALVRGFSLIAEEVQVRRRTIAHIEQVIHAAAECGSTLLAGPIYSPVGETGGRRRTSDEWRRAIDAYQQLGETLTAHGVTMVIEPLNRFETSFLNTVADAVALCAEVGHPRVQTMVDTFHANIEEKHVGDAITAARPHLGHIHISENDRGTPGTGHVDWPSVFKAIRSVGYDEWLTIEGFGFSLGDLSVAASIWRDIETSPEAIAKDGVRFVQRHWPNAGHLFGAGPSSW
jgi:D-psicose/D-tagatose/L-ribulose 3-epimerase